MKMRFTSLAAFLLVIAALAFVTAGCGGDDGNGNGDEATPEEPAEERDVSFDLRLGVVTSFTGDLSDFGEPLDRAGQIAVELIDEALDEQGVEGVSVEIVASEDDQTSATPGVEAATKLVQTDDVHVIIGSLASAVTIPIAESVAIPNQIVQISPASTSPAITFLEDDGFVWRTPPSDGLQGQLLADVMAEEFGAEATVNTGTRNDAYGTALIQVFEEAWREGGGTIGQSVSWNPEATTFDTEAQRLVQGSPDAWVIVDFPETWAKVGPAVVRAGGWEPEQTFTTDGLASDDLPGDVGERATEGMRGTRPAPGGEAPAGEAFGRVFEERAEGIGRQTFDAQAFDAVMLAFLAALKAGSSDPEAIRDNLQDVSGPPGDPYTFEELGDAIQAVLNGEDVDYEGASGPINFDENGDPSPEGAIYETWEFRGGALESLETFTYPFD
jgi:ABC-type branched-subunit amino acid transport system substrate-binding protein